MTIEKTTDNFQKRQKFRGTVLGGHAVMGAAINSHGLCLAVVFPARIDFKRLPTRPAFWLVASGVTSLVAETSSRACNIFVWDCEKASGYLRLCPLPISWVLLSPCPAICDLLSSAGHPHSWGTTSAAPTAPDAAIEPHRDSVLAARTKRKKTKHPTGEKTPPPWCRSRDASPVRHLFRCCRWELGSSVIYHHREIVLLYVIWRVQIG